MESLKHDKGVAGTTILLGLIVSLFIIGLIVMIFALMSGELQEATEVWNGSAWVQSDAGSVINATGSSLVGVTDFFDIFIVIGAMVVLVLLTVVIIVAIRSSGLMTADSA